MSWKKWFGYRPKVQTENPESSGARPRLKFVELEKRILMSASPLGLFEADLAQENEPPDSSLDHSIFEQLESIDQQLSIALNSDGFRFQFTDGQDLNSQQQTSSIDTDSASEIAEDELQIGPVGMESAESAEAFQYIFVDESLPDLQTLLDGLNYDTTTTRIVQLNSSRDGIQAITDALQSASTPVSSIQILTHGQSGQIQLGNSVLSNETLTLHQSDLELWGKTLTEDADILIYGCDVAESTAGQSLIDNIATWTGADVAASDDLTGHQALGGDWILEYAVGDVSTEMAFSLSFQASWYNVLDIVAAGGETLVNTSTPENQFTTPNGGGNLAMDDAGNYVVVWEDYRSGNADAYAKVYNADGSVRVNEFMVHATNGSIQDWTNVAMADNGNFVVTWSDYRSGNYETYMRLFDIDGTALTGETLVSLLAGAQDSHSVDFAADGSFVIAFTNFSDQDIYFQRFNSAGVAQGTNVMASSGSANLKDHGDVAVFDNGSFVITWESEISAGNFDVRARVFDATGTATSAEFSVNQATAGNQWRATVDSDATGNFVATWMSDDGNGYGIYARQFNASGLALGNEFMVNTWNTGDQGSPNVSVDDDGDFVIAWHDSSGHDGVGFGVYAQQYDSAGNTIGGETLIAQTTSNDQEDPTVAVQGTSAVIVWGGSGSQSGETDSSGVFFRQFSLSGVGPTLANVVPGSQSTNEDTSLIFSSGNGNQISITDDAGTSLDVTLSVTNGTLTLSGTTGLTFSSGDGTSDTTLTFSGTIEDINTALNGLSFDPTVDYNGGATLTIETSEATSALDVDAALDGRYTFDNTGALGTDDSGSGNTGTVVGATAFNDPTRGDVLNFDGNDYVEIAGHFGTPANLTLAAWVNLTTADAQGSEVISLGDSAILRLDVAGNLEGIFYDGSTWTVTSYNVTLAGTGWHHVAYSFNDAGNAAKLYLDGVEVASTSTFSSINYSLGANSFIGKHGNGGTTWDFSGLIDDARIYTRALSGAEVAELAAGGTPATDTDNVAITVIPDTDLRTTATTDGGLSLNADVGDDVYLEADASPFSGEGQVTVEVDFQVTTPATGLTTLLSYATGSNQDELYVGIDSGGEVFFRTSSNGGSGYGSITHAPELLDGNRHTLTVTWNSTGGILMFYVDGEQLGLGRNSYQTGSAIDAGGTLVFGQHQTVPGAGFVSSDTFEGTIYSARIFSDLRSEGEIAASYRSELPYDEAGMLAQWSFGNLSTDRVVTETVSGNNLTVKHTTELGFTASEASLTFAVDENAIDGTIVGLVSGVDAEREARIASLLAADTELHYNAETGKFYKGVSTTGLWSAARTAAESTALNSVNGQLVTIRSASENEFVRQIAANDVGFDVWIGATDSTVEGEWRWVDGGSEADQFWQGNETGYRTTGAYHNFRSGQPNDYGGNEDVVRLEDVTGEWLDADHDNHNFYGYIVEWDADAVLDANDALTYSIASQSVAGAFEIDASTGELRVADGSLLDFETNTTHTITIRTTDVDSNTYDETFTISLNDLAESNNAPSDLSSGIELNTDGGNDAYLLTTHAGTILGGLTETSMEVTFSSDSVPNAETPLFSYATSSIPDNVLVSVNTAGDLSVRTDSQVFTVPAANIPDLFDGQVHSVAFSWSSAQGSLMLYVDGDLVGSANGYATGAVVAGGPGDGTIVLGNEQDTLSGGFQTANTFNGTFYDLRLWNEVRSEAEIALNYQQKFDSGSLPSGLIANWQMDGFNGSNEVVDVVSGNNLSIGHATGAGFIASTPVEDLHISENATDGTTVGHVIPADPNVSNDIVSDGLFHEATPSTTQYGVTGTFGDWTVTQASVDLFSTTDWTSPLGGRVVNLDGSAPGAIEQSLTTVAGQQYQVIFALTGDFSGGEAVKNLRVSASGMSTDFQATQTSNWSWGETGSFEQRSFTFTADDITSVLQFQSLEGPTSTYGPYIADIQVIEIPAAVTSILNNDPTLSYDAATDKFYRFVNSNNDFNTQLAAANAAQLNGVSGQMVTIRSDYENELIRQFSLESGNDIWLGARDTNNDGNWNWLEGSVESAEQFWTGGSAGSATTGFFAPTFGQSEAAGEDYARMNTNGTWADDTVGSNNAFVIEWDASEVLSNFTFNLTDDAGGRFAIDQSTGEITVADGSLLDYETATNHDVTVQVTDAGGNSYSEAMTIAVNDVEDNAVLQVPIGQTVDEDVTLTFSTANGNAIIVDSGSPDNPILTVQLTVANGTLSLASIAGITFLDGTSNGDPTLSFSGTESDINTALEGLAYLGDPDYNGSDTLSVTTGSESTVEANVYARYEFLNGSIADESGNGYDGTATGDPTLTQDAERGDVMTFDGDDLVTVANGTAGLGEVVTIAAWVKLDAGVTDARFISIGDSFYVTLDPSATSFGMSVSANGFTTSNLNSINRIGGEGWHHVAATLNDTTNELNLYLDGVLIKNRIYDFGDINWATEPSQNITIGGLSSGASFIGSLDDVRVYDSELSISEIVAVMGDNGYATDDVVITINSVNDDPTYSGTIPTDITVVEDVASSVDLSSMTFEDPDAGVSDIQVILSTNIGGELTATDAGGVTVVGSGSDYVTFTGTLSELNTYFANTSAVQYLHPTANLNGNDADILYLQMNDLGNSGSGGGSTVTLGSSQIDITAVNDAPVLTPYSPVYNTTEGATAFSAPVASVLATSVSDVDSGAIEGLAVYSLSGSGGVLEYSIDGGSNWTVVFLVDSSNALLLRATDQIRFTPDNDQGGTLTLGYYAWDQTSGTAGGSADVTTRGGTTAFSSAGDVVTINVTDINDAPTQANIEGTELAYVENDGPVTITSALMLADVDDTHLESATVSITGSFVSSEDVLAFTDQNGITGAWNSTTGVLTLTGSATKAQYEAALRSVTYENTDNNPNTATRTIEFVINDGDANSNIQSRDVTIASINDDPYNNGTLPASITVTEDVASNVDLSGIELRDVDGSGGQSLTIKLSTSSGGNLYATTTAQVTVTGSGTGAMTLTGARTDLNAFLDIASSVTYLHGTANQTGVSADSIQAVANDNGNTGTGGGTDQLFGNVSVDISAVNDAPVVAAPGAAYSFTEQGSLDIHGTGFSVADVDDNGGAMTATFTVGEGRVLIDAGDSGVSIPSGAFNTSGNSTDTVTFTGTKDQINALLSGSSTGTIVYYHDQTAASDVPSVSTTITLTVNDQGNTGTDPGLTGDATSEEDSASQTINITAVNDAAAFLGPQLIINGTFDTDLSGWTKTGAVNQGIGRVSFGAGGSVGPHTLSQTIATSVGEAYVLEFDYRDGHNNLNQQLQVTVDGSANLLTTQQILTDKDDGSWVRYRFEFVADSTSSTLTLTDTSDDAGSLSATTNGVDSSVDNISVRQVAGQLGTASFTEDGPVVVLDSDVTLFDAEIDVALDDFDGTTLTLARNGGAISDDIFSATGNLVLNAGTVELSSTNIGSYTNAGGQMAITFNATATSSQVNEVLQSITYSNSNDAPPASVRIDWTFNDNNDGSQGTGPALDASGYTTVNITATNDAPVLNNSGAPALPTITEDEINNGGMTVADLLATGASGNPITDADGDPEGIAIVNRNNGRGIWEYSTDGGSNWGSIGTVSETGALLLRATDLVRFAPDGQNGNPTDRDFEFRAWDQTTGTAGTKVDVTTNGGTTAFSTSTEIATITTTDVNDAPVLDSSANLTLTSQAEDAGAPSGAVGTVITDLVSIGGNVTDVDASPQTGVAITAADTTRGTWWYTTDGGTTWNALGNVSDSSARVLNANSTTRIYFEADTDFNGTVSDAITFRAWDRSVGSSGSLQDASTSGGTSAFSSEIETADITITSQNDAPLLVGDSIVSNGGFEPDLTGWTATGNVDGDGTRARFGQIGGANGTLSQTLVTVIGETYLVSFDYGDFSVTNSQSIDMTVVGSNTLVDVSAYSGISENSLKTYQYTFVADSTSTTIIFTDTSANHSGVRGYLDNVLVATDATPSISIDYTENDGPQIIDSTLNIEDIDDTNIESATVQITGNYANGEDVLAFVDQNGIMGSWNSGSGTLTLTGSATLAQYETALRSITYNNTSEDPSTATRTVSFSVNDGAANSNTQTRDIDITAVNDAPVLENIYSTTLPTITEDEVGNPGQTVATMLVSSGQDIMTDIDSGSVEGIAVIVNNETHGTWQYSLDGGTNWLDFGSVSNASALLLRASDMIRFNPDGEQGGSSNFGFRGWDQTSGNNAGDRVNITATGGSTAFSSDTESALISVTQLNDAPTISNASAVSLTGTDEDTPSSPNIVSTILAGASWNDVDSTPQSGIAITGLTGNGTWEFSSGGVWTTISGVTSSNALLLGSTAQVRYVPDGENGETAEFTFKAWDQTSGTAATSGSPSYGNPGSGGGTSAYSSTETTAQLVVSNVNDSINATSDTDTAVEAGGIANGTTGTNPTGNVLSNDTDVDTGDTKTVTGVAVGTVTTPSGNVNTTVTGTYGSIVIASDGSYTYTVDNSNAAVQALRTSSDTLTDTFTYTATDGNGADSSTQIVLTIQGQNDDPTAVADSVAAVEAGGDNNGTPGSNPSGNVLTNDTDVDAGDTKTVVGVVAGTVGSATGNVASSVNGSYGSITINSDGSYSYTVDNSNAAVQALRTSGDSLQDTFTYTMQDTNGASSTTQVTVTITGQNDGPGAVDDTNTASEAGGTANGTGGSNPTGNVLTNDTDVDAGDTKTVVGVAAGSQVTTTGNVGSSVSGSYGDIAINSDGSYTYTVDNSNAAVQALRTSSDTISEVFTYTMEDSTGIESTAEITITIAGQNDAPVAVANTATAIEASGIGNNISGTDPTGNVLTNDTDVDAGDSKTVVGVAVGVQASASGSVGTSVTGSYGSLTINSDGAYSYVVDNNNAAVEALIDGQSLNETYTYTVTDTDGLESTTQITITIEGRTDSPVAEADMATAEEDGGYANAATGSNPSGNVLDNDSTNNGKQVIGVAAGSTGSASGNVGVSVVGTYGTAVINTDGTYTYTLDNSNPAVEALLTSGDHVTDIFTYTMEDAFSNVSSTELTITVDGQNDAIVAIADSGTAVEAGGVNNATAGINSTGNVVSNDMDVDSGDTKTVVGVAAGAQGSTAGNVGASVTGAYGAIVINNDGSYTYVVDENNATVQALAIGQSTTDTFSYTVEDTAGLEATTQIVITIQGANDTATAVSDTASATEAGGSTNGTSGVDPTGNVLTNDTDTDSGDTKTVVGVAVGVQGSAAGSVGSAVTGSYGSITINSDGSYTYTVDNSNSTVQSLRTSGETLTDTFTYSIEDTNGDVSTTQIVVTVHGANDDVVAVNDSATAVEASGTANATVGTNPTGNVLTNDTDVDAGDTKTVSGVAAGVQGLASGSVGSSVNGSYGSITINSDGSYSYLVDNSNAAVQALLTSSDTLIDTFSYTVTDTAGGISTTQIAITIEGGDDAPESSSDTGTATEAGGVSNGSGGSDAIGNVLSNDAQIDTGDTWTVDGVAAGSVGTQTTGTGLPIAGSYGTITINGDGSYTYVIDQSNGSVEALRTTTNTLTDTFTYTLSDAGGQTSTTQIVLTIEGSNDTPIAIADTATAVENSGAGNSVAGTDPTGNVLTNDTDVDTGDSKTVSGVAAGVQGTTSGNVGVSVNGSYGSISINSDGSYTYQVDNANATVQSLRTTSDTLTDTFSYTMIDAAGATSTTQITVTIQGGNDEAAAVDDSGTAVEANGVNNGTAGSNATGNVLANDTDLDSGDTQTVVGVASGSQIIASGSVGSSVTGTYGSITIDANGAYTFVIDESNAAVQALRNGADTLQEVFTYTMQDAGGLDSTAKITITIQGSNDTPTAVADTVTAVEAGGNGNAIGGTDPTGNVLTNDTDVDAGDNKTVSGVAAGVQGSTSGNVGSAVSGSYGSITINPDGSYTYAVDNSNAAVEALRTTSDTLVDTFSYTMVDGAGNPSTTTIAVTIQGSNDDPIAVADSGIAVEAGGVANATAGSNATGNVLTNDTDVDTGDSQTVSGAAAGVQVSTSGSIGSSVTGTYGSVTINSDGSYTYVIDENNAAVQALRTAGDTLDDVFSYTVTDTDGRTSTNQVTITIQGVNDNPHDMATTGLTVQENTANTTVVGTITSSDVDSGDSATYSLVDDANGRFAIDSGGILTVADSNQLDYETATSHSITVRVTDADGATYDEIFTVNLTDQDEFDVGAIADVDANANTIAEDATIGDSVSVTAFANDADATNNTVTYTLDNDAGGLFDIDLNSGVVTVAGALDYETSTNHNIVVRADSSDGSTTTQSFTINLTDVNEGGVTSISDIDPAADFVVENSAVGTTVGLTAFASDPDGTDSVAYTLDNDAGGRFSVDTTTGIVTVAGGIDRESASTYSITVRATSTDASFTTQTYSIAIGDVDEFDVSTPTDSDGANNEVNENATIGTSVGLTADAFDLDATNNTITYSLTNNTDGLFQIDPTTGEVTTAAAIDRETHGPTRSITIEANSSDGSSASQSFNITINDLDEFDITVPVDVDASTNQVDENSSIGTSVGVTAFASDADSTTNGVTYSLDSDASGRFSIDSASGVVTVAGGIDFETASSHSITVRATSADGSFATQTFTVAVNDVNEAPIGSITDTDASLNTVAENSTNGTVVGVTANAVDPDGTAVVSYSLDDDAGSRFAIDPNTGVVTVGGGIDREAAGSYDITIRATSSDGSFTNAVLTINVSDVNEFSATANVDADGTADFVLENSAVGTSVGITAFSDDLDSTDSISYSLDDDASGQFAIDSTTGEVTVNGTIDREIGANRTITVRATSTDGSFVTKDYTIAVGDVDEFDVGSPVDVDVAINRVNENSAIGTVVAITASANDNDATTNTISYSMVDDDNGRFQVDSSTGVVTTAAILDRESDGPSRTITVRATSSDGSISDTNFTVLIDDVDEFDATAAVDVDTSTNQVNENAVVGSIVGITANSIDGDATTNTVSYSLSDDDGGNFAIDAVTGVVTTAVSLDRESIGASRNITVRSTSSDGSTVDQDFSINIVDVDEFDVTPIIDTDSTVEAVAEAASVGSSIGFTASAFDSDATNSTVTYSLVSNPGSHFSIDSNSGIVAVAGGLDYETTTSHTLTVRATSGDGSWAEHSFVVQVTDSNEFSVTSSADIDSSANQVNEHASVGSLVGITALAVDEDGTDSVSYLLSDSAGGRFAIDSVTGVVELASTLDFELASSHSVTVRALSDDGSFTDTVFVVNVLDQNDAPTNIVLLNNTIEENASVGQTVGALQAIDQDSWDSHSFQILGGTGQGIFALDSAGNVVVANASINYEVNSQYSLTVRATDQAGTWVDQTLTVTVVDKNDLPVAINDSFVVAEDQWLTGNVIAGSDTDQDGDSLVAQLVSGPVNAAQFQLNPDGTFDYRGGQDFNGTDSFQYRVFDGQGNSNVATVQIQVTSVNDAPIGANDLYLINQADTLEVLINGVLNNDIDVDIDPLVAIVVQQPVHGSLVFQADGTFRYQPDNTFFGTDEFTYVANDGTINGNVVRVQIVIQGLDNSGQSSTGDPTPPDNDSSSNNKDITAEKGIQDQSEPENDLVAVDANLVTAESIGNNQSEPVGKTDSKSQSTEGENVGSEDSAKNYALPTAKEAAGALERILNSAKQENTLRLADLQLELRDIDSISVAYNVDRLWGFMDQESSERDTNELESHTIFENSLVTGSIIATAGYVLWTLRGGVLVATMMTTLPSWKFIDPLPVLDSFDDNLDGEDTESIQSLLDNASDASGEN